MADNVLDSASRANVLTDEEARRLKEDVAAEMLDKARQLCREMTAADERLYDYVYDVARYYARHSLNEVLCVRRFLRLLHACSRKLYRFDACAVRDVLFDAEGEWDGVRHVRGGLMLDGMYGRSHYRLTSLQVFVLAWVYGFTREVCLGKYDGRPLLDEECVRDGMVYDRRRLVRHFTCLMPRKVAKTFLGAFIQFEGFMRGERDYEGYICANSGEQSSLLFRQLADFVRQMQGWEQYIKITDNVQSRCVQWLPSSGRAAKVVALTAGGKTKDGLKASCCSADEFGAARRVRQSCDMENLINVVEGSMGPRRNPLTFHTSTAGLGVETPYEVMVRRIVGELVAEARMQGYWEADVLPGDRYGAVMLMPDQWETDDASLRTEAVIRKVNPHLGITVQTDYYTREWEAVDVQGDAKRKEVVTKLYNIFETDKLVDWILPQELVALQCDKGVTDLDKSAWVAWCGMDFSKGDDLCSLGWVCINTKTRQVLWDATAWIAEEQLNVSPNAALYREWYRMGWLRISPGSTINEELVLSAIVEASEHVRIVQFGYDAYDSLRFVNAIKAWIASRLVAKGLGSAAVADELRRRVVPVSQTWATYNASTQVVWDDVKWRPRRLWISQNPIIPWCFGNAVLEEDRMGNRKPVKRSPSAKVDACQTICTCYIMIGAWQGGK